MDSTPNAPRNDREAHAELLDAAHTALLAAAAQHRRAHRIAPTPTGSREIPSWLLAVLAVLTIAALALFAPGVQA